MATSWFDQLAKRSARSAPPVGTTESVVAGPTRRQVLARGAVVAGAAWTAPMLMGVQPAYAGASQCPANTVFSVCPGDGGFLCCPAGEQCFENSENPGTYICQVPLGGVCGNQGFGQCNGNRSRCNQSGGNPNQNPSICGGPGTICSDGSICVPTSPCFGVRCGGVGAPCTSNSQCAPTTGSVPGTTCVNGTCQLATATPGGANSRRDAGPTTQAPAPTATATQTPEPPPPSSTPPATTPTP